MNIASSPELREIMNEVYYHPAVSIIEPFEPKMVQKARLTHSLEICADKVECILRTSYSVEIVELMMQKIRGIISDLNFCTHKKSIAIYVTPVFEKLLYLDMPVEEKIIIDGSFEIRDVVYNKKQQQQYLVMFLHNRKYSIYWWNNTSFIRIVASSCLSMDLQIRDIPQRTSNFTNAAKVKQTLMDNFLRLIDNSLAQILYSYHLPVFIVGTDKILGHFKKITKHARSIINYIHGNYEDIINNQLQEILKPYTEHWEKVRQQDLLNQLEDAADKRSSRREYATFGMKLPEVKADYLL